MADATAPGTPGNGGTKTPLTGGPTGTNDPHTPGKDKDKEPEHKEPKKAEKVEKKKAEKVDPDTEDARAMANGDTDARDPQWDEPKGTIHGDQYRTHFPGEHTVRRP